MPKTIEELDEELCKYCPYTDYGDSKVNTGPLNLCLGSRGVSRWKQREC